MIDTAARMEYLFCSTISSQKIKLIHFFVLLDVFLSCDIEMLSQKMVFVQLNFLGVEKKCRCLETLRINLHMGRKKILPISGNSIWKVWDGRQGVKWFYPFKNGSAGVNFTIVLWAAFTLEDPESAKKVLDLTVFFALLVSTYVKAACRTLMKLTPGFVDVPHPFFRLFPTTFNPYLVKIQIKVFVLKPNSFCNFKWKIKVFLRSERFGKREQFFLPQHLASHNLS